MNSNKKYQESVEDLLEVNPKNTELIKTLEYDNMPFEIKLKDGIYYGMLGKYILEQSTDLEKVEEGLKKLDYGRIIQLCILVFDKEAYTHEYIKTLIEKINELENRLIKLENI